MKEDCKETLGIDCIEKIMTGLNRSGEIRKLTDGDLASVLDKALSK